MRRRGLPWRRGRFKALHQQLVWKRTVTLAPSANLYRNALHRRLWEAAKIGYCVPIRL